MWSVRSVRYLTFDTIKIQNVCTIILGIKKNEMKNKDIEEFDRKYSTIMKIQWLVMCTKKEEMMMRKVFPTTCYIKWKMTWWNLINDITKPSKMPVNDQVK